MNYILNGSGDILSINGNNYEYDGFNRIIGAKTLLPGNESAGSRSPVREKKLSRIWTTS